MKNVNEYDKIYIYSSSLQENFDQRLFKCFRYYISINIIPTILTEEDIDVVIEETVNNKDFEKSDTVIETYESIEELKFPQEYDDGGFFILDDLNEKEMNDPRVQAMFKRSRHNNSSVFIISQDYFELPKKTIRANGNIYRIFKLNNYRAVRNLYQHKASMNMPLKEYKYLTITCWKKVYQTLTIHNQTKFFKIRIYYRNFTSRTDNQFYV